MSCCRFRYHSSAENIPFALILVFYGIFVIASIYEKYMGAFYIWIGLYIR